MKYIKSQPHPQAGLGHQFHNWALGYIISKKFNCEFIHTKLTPRIRNGSKPQTWDDFLNIGKGLKTKVKVTNNVLLPKIELGHKPKFNPDTAYRNLSKWEKIIKNSPEGTMFKLPVNHYIGVLSEEIYEHSEHLKSCYWEGKEIYDFGNNKTNVVVHIRRGDVSKKGNTNRWLELSDYKKQIEYIRKKYDKVKFHILSEGNVNEFNVIKSDDVNLYINHGDLQSFNMMCSSDILITGLSSFSILASYLTKGTVFYNSLLNFTRWDDIENFYNIKNYV